MTRIAAVRIRATPHWHSDRHVQGLAWLLPIFVPVLLHTVHELIACTCYGAILLAPVFCHERRVLRVCGVHVHAYERLSVRVHEHWCARALVRLPEACESTAQTKGPKVSKSNDREAGCTKECNAVACEK